MCTHVGVSGHVGAYVRVCVYVQAGVWVHVCTSECDVCVYL